MRGEDGGLHRPPSEVVSQLIAAVSDGRIEDLLALVDPGVRCIPATRPGRTVYEGHAGMARLVADLSAAYGPHRIEVEEITVESGTQVTARTRVLQESDHGDLLLRRITSVYTLRAGLVTSIEGDARTDPS
jgi:ketosteroid isomerase-like protein